MTQVPVKMKVFDVEPEGSPEDQDDRFECSMDPDTPQNELLKGCNVQMVITIKRSTALVDAFKYREPFLILINIP